MAEKAFRYVIVGGGLAGASAAQALRERDPGGSILLAAAEDYLPYDRPPLTKKLWTGQKTLEQVFLHPRSFYDDNGITLSLSTRIAALDPAGRTATDAKGNVYSYEKLLLAAGGRPRRLDIPGGDLEGVRYFRGIDDFLWSRLRSEQGMSATVIGGGFIGSELAASLRLNRVDVTMVFPSPYLCSRVFPQDLGRAVQADYEGRGVKVLTDDEPVSVEPRKGRFVTLTGKGRKLVSDLVVAGVGIDPEVSLARDAGLDVQNGVVVDRFLRTSAPDVYAAGDLCCFPYAALGLRMRVEHWDNAMHQGLCAGRNMAGGREPYDHLPYFFSDLFDLGYEAVGEVYSGLETFSDWRKEYRTGTVYYLGDGRVRGVLLCNVWGKLDEARALIREGKPVPEELMAQAVH